MKKKVVLVACSLFLALAGCGAESEKEVVLQKEPIPEVTQEVTQEVAQEASDVITQEQALDAIKNYCYANNPELEGMTDSEDYTIYFDVSTNEEDEIVVLYRSYTGAQTRYYVDPASGDVYVTELVPGIIDDETRTDETFNIKEYISTAN